MLVQKTAEPFETLAWRGADDSSAGGRATLSAQVPGEIAAKSKNALELEANFAGTGFQFFKGAPVQPLTIPGVTKNLSLWTRTDSRHGWVLSFKDGWGRSEANGKKLEWNVIPATNGTWQKMTFTVPGDWVQPLSIDNILVHNWESQNQKASVRLSLDQLEVETDIADVDAQTGILKTWKPPLPAVSPGNAAPGQTSQTVPPNAPVTPLLKVSLSGTQEHNVFTGDKPQFLLSAQNWRPATATGTLQWKLFDPQGRLLKEEKQALAVEDNFTLPVLPEVTKFGVYRLDSTIAWADGKKVDSSQPFALIPLARPLTAAEKEASPYGLNVHSGGNVMVSTFRKAGITWFRDYGFNFEWVVRAKGGDKSYGGWPYYPKIAQKYEENGGLVLANLATAIKPPGSDANAKTQLGPDLNWVREMAMFQMAFPSLRYFELDNEYDLNAGHAKAEDAIGWKNYGSYHRKFGDITQLLGNGQLVAVENGRAGIWPERVRRLVQSGDFASIDVVNSHHYTGTDAPELNVGNHNMGFAGDEAVMSFFDQLRAAKQAAISDGKPRQHWLTEFGWDTKAGPVVSHVEQAAYLQRAYMMLLAAGTEKGFWFFDLDAPKANQFFDGCGLFTHDKLPKLSYAAYAGLTQILPKPQYLGTINAGENTWGYLFRNEGKLVATLWTLDGKKGPQVNFEGAQLYDWFANPLNTNTAELGIEPVFAVGVAENSRWFQQAAYSLETPYLLSLTAGDSTAAKLQVKNTRPVAVRGKVRLQLPANWTAPEAETSFTAEAGQTVTVPLPFRVGTDEQLSEKKVRITISEGEAQAAPLHTIPLRVQIQRPIVMTVRGLKGEPGEGDVTVRLSNRSAQPLSGKLRFQLPESWGTATPEIAVEALKPMEVRDVTAKVRWAANWKQNESARVEFQTGDGRTAEQPLIPSRLTIYPAPNLVMDGDLKDWPARNRLPEWVLGSTSGKANAALYLAWSTQGLHVALDVRDSKASVPDPQNFWLGDVLELFVDTRDKKTPRAYEPGDHQFWLSPIMNGNKPRVYLGQWKRNDEIAATQFDIAGAPGASVKRADGYVLECLIPAAQMKGFNPAAGSKLGLNLNLSVKGMAQDREVYWAVPKADAVPQPANWGTITLGN